MPSMLRRLIDRVVRGSLAPLWSRLDAAERCVDEGAHRTESLAARLEEAEGRAAERAARLDARLDALAHDTAVCRRDLDRLVERINAWDLGDRLAQLSRLQQGHGEHSQRLEALGTRFAALQTRLNAHRLGERMAQLSALQRGADALASELRGIREQQAALASRLDAHHLGERMAQLSKLQGDVVALAASARASAAGLEEIRARLGALQLGDRLLQLTSLEQRHGQTREAVDAARLEHTRHERRLVEAERQLRGLIDRTQRWALGDRVQQVTRIERELRAHAEVQRRLDALLLEIAGRVAPDVAWLVRNREERMDAHSPLFRADRRALHLARYEFAAPLVRGLTVADIACGTGYGSALLARAGAARVIGIDCDAGAIEYARSHHAERNTEFVAADARRTPLADASADAIVSFETIEHVEDPERLLAEFARVLKPGGLLVLSTPNDWGLEHAPFHKVSLDLVQLRELLVVSFEIEQAWGQVAPAASDTARRVDSGTRDLAAAEPGVPPGFVRIAADDDGSGGPPDSGYSVPGVSGAECLVIVARAAQRSTASDVGASSSPDHGATA